MRHRLPVLVVGTLVLIAVGWTIAWHVIADTIEADVQRWADARRAEGLTITRDSFTVDGFPFIWRIDVQRPDVTGAGPTGWHWQGERVEVTYLPWTPDRISMRFPGRHRLTVGSGDLARNWTMHATRADGAAVLQRDGRLDTLDLSFATIEIAGNDLALSAAEARGKVRLHRPPDADYRTPTFDLTLHLVDAVLPESLNLPLGRRIDSAAVDLSFKGRLAYGTLAEAVTAWRDSGGTIEFSSFALKWGQLAVAGDGTFALDQQNRPLAAFATRLRGHNEAIDTLVAVGRMTPREAAGVKIALNLLSRQNRTGNETEASIPLTIQDGRLFASGLPLMRVEPLRLD